jgi:hypothetical protein
MSYANLCYFAFIPSDEGAEHMGGIELTLIRKVGG